MKNIVILIVLLNNFLYGLTQKEALDSMFNTSEYHEEIIKRVGVIITVKPNYCSNMTSYYDLVIKTNIDPYNFQSITITPIDLNFYINSDSNTINITNKIIYLSVDEHSLKEIFNNTHSSIEFYAKKTNIKYKTLEW